MPRSIGADAYALDGWRLVQIAAQAGKQYATPLLR
jgi:hypothetical protein